MIEHTLSAYHDITHGAGLAVVNPAWMRFAASHRQEKFVQFAERISVSMQRTAAIWTVPLKALTAFEAFLKSIGHPPV